MDEIYFYKLDDYIANRLAYMETYGKILTLSFDVRNLKSCIDTMEVPYE